MKKLNLLSLLAIFAVVALASCSSTPKEDELVAQKLEQGQTLSDQEITTLINYVGEYAKKAQGEVDDEVNGTQVQQAQVDMEKLNEEYVYIPVFRKYLENLDFTTLSNENIELIRKYAHYEEFTIPPRMDFSVDPAVKSAGVEVETPASGTDSNVVATGVEEAKVENK